MCTVPSQGLLRGKGAAVLQQLQAKVTGSLASRGVSVDGRWETKPSTKLTDDDKKRLERQRTNKRNWARKEREKTRKTLENLKQTNNQLEYSNTQLRRQVDSLRKGQFYLESYLLDHKCRPVLCRTSSCPVPRHESGPWSQMLASQSDDGLDLDMTGDSSSSVHDVYRQADDQSSSCGILDCSLTSDGEQASPFRTDRHPVGGKEKRKSESDLEFEDFVPIGKEIRFSCQPPLRARAASLGSALVHMPLTPEEPTGLDSNKMPEFHELQTVKIKSTVKNHCMENCEVEDRHTIDTFLLEGFSKDENSSESDLNKSVNSDLEILSKHEDELMKSTDCMITDTDCMITDTTQEKYLAEENAMFLLELNMFAPDIDHIVKSNGPLLTSANVTREEIANVSCKSQTLENSELKYTENSELKYTEMTDVLESKKYIKSDVSKNKISGFISSNCSDDSSSLSRPSKISQRINLSQLSPWCVSFPEDKSDVKMLSQSSCKPQDLRTSHQSEASVDSVSKLSYDVVPQTSTRLLEGSSVSGTLVESQSGLLEEPSSTETSLQTQPVGIDTMNRNRNSVTVSNLAPAQACIVNSHDGKLVTNREPVRQIIAAPAKLGPTQSFNIIIGTSEESPNGSVNEAANITHVLRITSHSLAGDVESKKPSNGQENGDILFITRDVPSPSQRLISPGHIPPTPSTPESPISEAEFTSTRTTPFEVGEIMDQNMDTDIDSFQSCALFSQEPPLAECM